ncbi:MAG: hypothetical protein KF881_13735 [Acidobacteria bacterium]|nr:hypothetical protein [Acidobacteriota bacterium]
MFLDLRRMFLDLRRMFLDLRRMFLDLRRMFLDLRRMFFELRRMFFDLRKMFFDLRKMFFDLRKMFFDYKRSFFGTNDARKLLKSLSFDGKIAELCTIWTRALKFFGVSDKFSQSRRSTWQLILEPYLIVNFWMRRRM